MKVQRPKSKGVLEAIKSAKGAFILGQKGAFILSQKEGTFLPQIKEGKIGQKEGIILPQIKEGKWKDALNIQRQNFRPLFTRAA